jgi:leader peptidase (prepilin peptidase)/N-methyltransferase
LSVSDPPALRQRTEALLVAAASVLVILAMALKFGIGSRFFLVYSGLGLVLVGVTVFDIRKQIIPHIVTIPGMAAGLIIGTFVLPMGFLESLLGLVVGGGILLAAALFEMIRKKEIGGGDWKYAAMIGSFIGWQKIIIALALMFPLAAIGHIVLHVMDKGDRPQALGPWLSAGALVSILIG